MKIQARHKLIPAIAMLLVAVVCLSSASYAWFTMSRTVTATGMNLTVIAPDNLLISNQADGTYAETTTVTESFGDYKLLPASSVDGQSFYYAEALKSANAGAPDATTNFIATTTPVSASSDGYFADFKLWLKTTGEDAIDVTVAQILTLVTTTTPAASTYYSNVAVTADTFAAYKATGNLYTWEAAAEGTDTLGASTKGTATAAGDSFVPASTYCQKTDGIKDALRFAVLDQSGIPIYPFAGTNYTPTTAASNSVYGVNAGVSNVNYFTGITGAVNEAGTGKNIGATTAVNSGAALFKVQGGGAATPITVRVWIEGQDINCISAIANTTVNLQVGFRDYKYVTGETTAADAAEACFAG